MICYTAFSWKEPKPRTLCCNNSWLAKKNNTFRFCGKEFQQDEHFGIRVTAEDNTERVQPITFDAKHSLTRKATANEVHQLRAVTRSLAWIARETRLDLSYRMSKIQSTLDNSCVRDLRECNRIVEYSISTSTRGIYFHRFYWHDAVVATISDASFCQRTGKCRRTHSELSNHKKLASQHWRQVIERRKDELEPDEKSEEFAAVL